MLGNTNAMATVAVKDVHVARRFYEGVLGLKAAPSDEPSVLLYKAGTTSLLVYPSQYAGTNEATAVTWIVEGVEALVEGLKAKGVRFEHYDLPGVTRKGDIHFAGKLKNAWFKDPDGNIHALVNG